MFFLKKTVHFSLMEKKFKKRKIIFIQFRTRNYKETSRPKNFALKRERKMILFRIKLRKELGKDLPKIFCELIVIRLIA